MFRFGAFIQRIEPSVNPWCRGFSTCRNLLSTQLAIQREDLTEATAKDEVVNKTKILSQDQMNQVCGFIYH